VAAEAGEGQGRAAVFGGGSRRDSRSESGSSGLSGGVTPTQARTWLSTARMCAAERRLILRGSCAAVCGLRRQPREDLAVEVRGVGHGEWVAVWERVS
jgi:hypothetical protein